MGFSELLQQLQTPGEDGLPATIYDDLAGEYASLQDGGAATIAQRDDRIVALESEISRLKAVNYDLMMNGQENNEPDDSSDDDSDADDDGESISIDDLFGEDD